MLPKHNSRISRETLVDLGFNKLIQESANHEALREGLGFNSSVATSAASSANVSAIILVLRIIGIWCSSRKGKEEEGEEGVEGKGG
jgi:hypothetical protein